MKVLCLLFLVFKVYSFSLQYIPIGNTSLTPLTPSTDFDYFFFLAVWNRNTQIVLLDNGYKINNIRYCNAYSYPTEQSIDTCLFYDLTSYDSKSTPLGTEYYYEKQIGSGTPYIIIRYSGKNVNGTIKASAVVAYIEKIETDSFGIPLTGDVNSDTYFYSSIYFGYEYIYFNLTDTSQYINKTIHYCLTNDHPKNNYLRTIRSCSFSPLDYYKKGRTFVNDEFYYQVYTRSYYRNYVVVRYNYSSSSGSLYAQSSYQEFKEPSKPTTNTSLSTLSIVFIAIAGVALLGIMLTIICYYCGKRKANNIAYVPTKPAVVDSNPSIPLVQQNNMQPTY